MQITFPWGCSIQPRGVGLYLATPKVGRRSGGRGKELAMTTLTTYPAPEQTAGTIGESPAAPVYAVVGFDGSPPAIRALDGAARLLHGRVGGLEIVFVAHV